MYSYKKNDESTSKAAKRVEKNVTDNGIRHENYVHVLFKNKMLHHQMKTIRSEYHPVSSYQIHKVSLSYFDDKRYHNLDGIRRYAYGHCNI